VNQFRIGDVAARAGIATSRIRYYEEIGLLPAPERISGKRRYDDTVLRRLSVIDVAQRAASRSTRSASSSTTATTRCRTACARSPSTGCPRSTR